jgi:hypothetical protein
MGLGWAGIYRISCAYGRQAGLTIRLRTLRHTTFDELTRNNCPSTAGGTGRLDVAGHGPALRLAGGGQPCGGGCQEAQPTEQRITELYDRSTERPIVDSLAGTPLTDYVRAFVGPVSPNAQEEQWAHLVQSATAPSSP